VTDDELLSQIDIEEKRALGYFGGDLAAERERALEYYQGNLESKYAAQEGRSDIVSTDVRDGIDGMLPDLLDIFLSSDDVVKFDPQGPEDEQAAKQATDACNYVFYRQNPGALILYEWFKSAMKEKNGVVKYYHERYATPVIEEYEALNEPQFQMLVSQPGVSVMAHSASPDPQAPPGSGFSLHDVRVRIVDPTGKICVEGLPSEEFLISPEHNSLSLRDVPYCSHRRKLTVSDIRAMGIDVDPEEADDPVNEQMTPEWWARRRFNEERMFTMSEAVDPALKKLQVSHISMLTDFDGDGYAERRSILKIGRRVYQNDYADHVPFAAICPNIEPFRFIGRSSADDLMDLQLMKTGIWRGSLDSLAFTLRPQIGVWESMANLDDLLVRRPGGVVRFKTNPNMAWAPLEHRFVGQAALPMLEYADSVKENRTGFSRYNQGLDADSLNKTATGVSLITAASAKRQKLTARMFAETGMKDLFRGINGLLIKHNPRPMLIRLRNQFIEVDPRSWKTQWDMTVNVGLGTGDQAQQAAHLQGVMAVQKELLMAGKSHMVTDANLYNSAKRLAETAGFKQEGEFFTQPDANNPPPPPPPSPEVIKAQMEAQNAEADRQHAERIKQAELLQGENVAKIQQETSFGVANINAAAELKKEEMRAQTTLHGENLKADNARALEDKKQEGQAQIEIFRQGGASPGKRGGEQMKTMQTASDAIMQAVIQLSKDTQELLKAVTADREVMRDKNGNIVGTRAKTNGSGRPLQ
jgi:hypothetical protein